MVTLDHFLQCAGLPAPLSAAQGSSPVKELAAVRFHLEQRGLRPGAALDRMRYHPAAVLSTAGTGGTGCCRS